MAVRKATRATARMMKDKWRAKQWYTITSPDIFGNREIPSTPADDPAKLYGRVVQATMQELTSDFSKSNIKLKFKINKVVGFEAKTIFIGHELTSDYIRRLTRRRRTKVDGIFDVITKDGYKIRVKPIAIAENRIQSSQKTTIRKLMEEAVLKRAKVMIMGDFIKALISGDISRDIFKACKPIYRLKRVDIRRSEILGQLSAHKVVEKDPEDIDTISDEEEVSDAVEGELQSETSEEEIPDGYQVSEEAAEEGEPEGVEEEIPQTDTLPEEPEASEEIVEDEKEVADKVEEEKEVVDKVEEEKEVVAEEEQIEVTGEEENKKIEEE